MWSKPPALLDGHFTAKVLDPAHPRWFFFYHAQRQMGAAIQIRGDESKPLSVRLQPCGCVTGRVFDARGNPWPGLGIYGKSETKYMSITTLRWWSHYVSACTGADGRFRMEGLIPGVEYRISVGEHRYSVTLASGEAKELGDVKD